MKKTLLSSHACGVHAVKSQTVKFSQDLADIFWEMLGSMLEYWKWWTMTESEGRHIFSMVFKGRFFWDRKTHLVSDLRKSHWPLQKMKYAYIKVHKISVPMQQKIFQDLWTFTYNKDITTPPLTNIGDFPKLLRLTESVASNLALAHAHHLGQLVMKKIHTEVRLIRVRYYVYIYIHGKYQ